MLICFHHCHHTSTIHNGCVRTEIMRTSASPEVGGTVLPYIYQLPSAAAQFDVRVNIVLQSSWKTDASEATKARRHVNMTLRICAKLKIPSCAWEVGTHLMTGRHSTYHPLL